jgi:glycosyltransferase involved in cell wall biosynthesis
MTPGSVLIVTPRWTRDGGVATHAQASAAALAAHGVSVSVLTGAGGEGPPGVDVIENPGLFDAGVAASDRVAAAAGVSADVVHLHQVDHPDLVEALRRLGPVVTSAHGYVACTSGVHYFQPGHECTRAHGPGCVPNLLLRGCAHTRYPRTLPVKYANATRARSAFELADLAVSHSSAVDRHLADNGIGRRAIVPLFPTMPAAEGTGHADRRRVVFAGRLIRSKGVEVLIRAAGDLDAELVICGDGRERKALEGLAGSTGVLARVRFTGWLDPTGLAAELADASVVAIPSLWPEPFGLVGIEAFAAGRPVVASGTGGVGDWLDDGVSGLSVPPGDVRRLAGALAQMLSDPERQAAMGGAGRAVVAERFTAARHVQALLAAYELAAAHRCARR